MWKELTFLGHKVGAQGVSTVEDKVIAVRDWPVPKNVLDMLSFLGLGFLLLPLHCQVLNCGCIAKPADMQGCAVRVGPGTAASI